MRKGAFVLGLLGLLSPAALRAEGVAIDHRDRGLRRRRPVPPAERLLRSPSGLARARVYFRVADAPPDWYYVEMASDAPCHAGILPRPKKELVGRRIQYYVDAFDRSFAESRTPEAEALVVSSASECAVEAAGRRRSSTARPSPSSRACPPASPAGGGRPRGRGHRRASRSAAPRSWGAGWPWRRAGRRDGPRIDTHRRPSRRGRCPPRPCRRRPPPPPRSLAELQPRLQGLRGPDPRRGRHDRGHRAARAPLRHVRDRPAASPCATRSRWTECMTTDRCNSAITFTTVCPRARTSGSRRCASSATSRTYVGADDDPVGGPEQRPEGATGG